MYPALINFHIFMSAAALLLTMVWVALAWKSEMFPTPRGGVWLSYIAHQVTTGLTGVSGLAAIVLSGWRSMIFPYLGLLLIVAHGIAGATAKRGFGRSEKRLQRQMALAIQMAAYLLALYLMEAKPF